MYPGRPIQYDVSLSELDIAKCKLAVLNPNTCPTIVKRCDVLLGLNNCVPGKLNRGQVALAHCCNKDYVSSVAKSFNEGGIGELLQINRNPNSDIARLRFGAREEAILISLACTPPPSPHPRWTHRLCAKVLNQRLEEMGLPGNFSVSTISRALTRNELHPHLSEYWCIPEVTPIFILRMEKLLQIYHLPYNSDYPVVCMDEAALILIRDRQTRLIMAPGAVEKLDYQYARMGTKNIFVFIEPKTGQYYVRATDRHTAKDWAYEVKHMVDCLYPTAKRVILISDNLNTHNIESLYKTFPPEEAKRIADRIVLIHTPVHASWLNIAEIGINVLKVECIGRRFRTGEEVQALPARLSEWQEIKNTEKKAICWKFSVENAREHPHLYRMETTISDLSSEKYATQNAFCLPTPYQGEGRSLVPYDCASEDGEIIELCRAVDENGQVYWTASCEEKRVCLHEPVGKKQIAPLIGQRNTADGWPIPFASKPRTPKNQEKKPAKVVYDYAFMAYGEELVDVYNRPYDPNCPVICIQKRPLSLENPLENAWVGNLRAEAKPKAPKKTEDESTKAKETPEVEEQDSRLGITFVYNPNTGEKRFLINDWTDDSSWALTLKDLVDEMYPTAQEINLVLCEEAQDKIGALEQVFKADEALRIFLKFNIHVVPDSARWLNFAENEAISVCRQCVKDGAYSVEQVSDHLKVWQQQKTFVEFKVTVEGFRRVFSSVYRPPETFSSELSRI